MAGRQKALQTKLNESNMFMIKASLIVVKTEFHSFNVDVTGFLHCCLKWYNNTTVCFDM